MIHCPLKIGSTKKERNDFITFIKCLFNLECERFNVVVHYFDQTKRNHQEYQQFPVHRWIENRLLYFYSRNRTRPSGVSAVSRTLLDRKQITVLLLSLQNATIRSTRSFPYIARQIIYYCTSTLVIERYHQKYQQLPVHCQIDNILLYFYSRNRTRSSGVSAASRTFLRKFQFTVLLLQ